MITLNDVENKGHQPNLNIYVLLNQCSIHFKPVLINQLPIHIRLSTILNIKL